MRKQRFFEEEEEEEELVSLVSEREREREREREVLTSLSSRERFCCFACVL